MNFKQKLVYMLIGCLFTLAGYFLASLGGTVSQTNKVHAQQNAEQVIDKIVCRELTVVDENGTPIASLKPNKDPFFPGGSLRFYNFEGQETVRLDSSISGSGSLRFYNLKGQETIRLNSSPATLSLNDSEGKSAVFLAATGGDVGGFLSLYGERKFFGEKKKGGVLLNAYELVITDGGKHTVRLSGDLNGTLSLYDGEEITVSLPR